MGRKVWISISLAALLLCTLFVSACATRSQIPEAGTRVTTTSEVFRQTARGLREDCERIGGCTCILDGIQTTCSVVFACLDAGFCRRVAAD
jgi:hypothetical protein